jgi:hypothetical protein
MPIVVLTYLNEAPVQHLVMEQGADFYLYRTLQAPELGDIVDWSDVTDIRFSMRERFDTAIVFQSDLTSGITFQPDGSLVTVKLTSAQTAALTTPFGVYDLFVKAGDDWSKVLKGNFRVGPSVVPLDLLNPAP